METRREASNTGVTVKPLLRSLKGEASARPPFWLMRQAGRYLPEYRALRERAGSFLALVRSPELAAEVTLQPLRRFGMDAAILFSDILIIAAALGQDLSFQEGEGPVLRAVRGPAGLGELRDTPSADMLEPIYETVRLVKAQLPEDAALIGFAGAPWTVATYMVEGGSSRDFAHVKGWAYGDPEGFTALIERLIEATVEYLSKQIQAGAEAVQLFDSWAGMLPEAAFRRWVIEPTRRIVERLAQLHPGVPAIGFPRGAGLMYRAYFSETKVNALGLDQSVPCSIIAKTLQPIGAVQGNLDPLLLVAGGPAMESAVAEIRSGLAGGPFVFNLGHGILPETPVEHVARLAELLRSVP